MVDSRNKNYSAYHFNFARNAYYPGDASHAKELTILNVVEPHHTATQQYPLHRDATHVLASTTYGMWMSEDQ